MDAYPALVDKIQVKDYDDDYAVKIVDNGIAVGVCAKSGVHYYNDATQIKSISGAYAGRDTNNPLVLIIPESKNSVFNHLSDYIDTVG